MSPTVEDEMGTACTQTHQAAERSKERVCCCSQRRADKAFGRKGLANDYIPHNPCTVIFTSKEPPIQSFGSGWNCLAVRLPGQVAL